MTSRALATDLLDFRDLGRMGSYLRGLMALIQSNLESPHIPPLAPTTRQMRSGGPYSGVGRLGLPVYHHWRSPAFQGSNKGWPCECSPQRTLMRPFLAN